MGSDLSDTPASDTTDGLAEFILETEFEAIPQDALEVERLHVLDSVGCALYGATLPWIQNLVRSLQAAGEPGSPNGAPGRSASVFGSETSLPPARASLVNGTAVHALEFDDHCSTAGVHAGATVIPAALAYAQAAERPISGTEFLAAVTIGVEVGVRSGYGIGIGSLERGFHIAGWTGAFGSAAAVGKLHGLDVDAMGHALGLAGTQGCGLTGAHTSGADAKRLHMGKASEAGYLSVHLADQGFTGDRRIFEDRRGGVGRSLSGDFDLDAVTKDLGDDYQLLEKLTLKKIPGLGMIHPPIEALENIVNDTGIELADVDTVTVGTTEVSYRHGGDEYQATGIIAAQANIQYAVASFLLDGGVSVSSFTEDAIRRPSVLERTEDVDVFVDDHLEQTHPDGFGAVVTVEMNNGAQFEDTVLSAPGSPNNRLSTDELSAKFHRQAEHVLDDNDVNRAFEFLSQIRSKNDVAELFNIIDVNQKYEA